MKQDARKKILFIDRDGTLILEPSDHQVDSFEKLEFYPKVLRYLPRIARELDFELVLVSNQDGLGTSSYPEENFRPTHDFMLRTLKNEGVVFAEQFIDRTFAKDKKPTRKPGTGLLTQFFDQEKYDLANSYVIGDRLNDVLLAQNLGAKALWLRVDDSLGQTEGLQHNADSVALETTEWEEIYAFLKHGARTVSVRRKTNETDIEIDLDLDGRGKSAIDTGLAFFDHMLDQIARHGRLDLRIKVVGDLEVDEHHTIEDTGIALGEAIARALGNKLGIERYAFVLPMDDCVAEVAIDFGGRNELIWNAKFKREKVGDMPTEMFEHFFKSFTDAAKCNLFIRVKGKNEHHKIESIFKAFAKVIRKAVKRDLDYMELPSTKGII